MGKQFSTSTSHKRWPCTTSLIFLLDRQTDSYVVFGGNNVRLGFCQISKDFYKDFPRSELSCSKIFQSENYFQLRLDTSFFKPIYGSWTGKPDQKYPFKENIISDTKYGPINLN